MAKPTGSQAPIYCPQRSGSDTRGGNKVGFTWIGDRVQVSETCDDEQLHLITPVDTTLATVPDVSMTAILHQTLVDKNLQPNQHLVNSG